MDKYFYLVRQFLYVSLRYLAKGGWKDTEMLGELVAALSEIPLNARDMKVPNGLRYHMLDIYLDEMEKVNEEHEADIPAEKLLAPIRALQKDCPTKNIRRQAKEIIRDERVREWLGVEDEEEAQVADEKSKKQDAEQQEEEDGGDWSGFDD